MRLTTKRKGITPCSYLHRLEKKRATRERENTVLHTSHVGFCKHYPRAARLRKQRTYGRVKVSPFVLDALTRPPSSPIRRHRMLTSGLVDLSWIRSGLEGDVIFTVTQVLKIDRGLRYRFDHDKGPFQCSF